MDDQFAVPGCAMTEANVIGRDKEVVCIVETLRQAV
jgi:hypothetical protein